MEEGFKSVLQGQITIGHTLNSCVLHVQVQVVAEESVWWSVNM